MGITKSKLAILLSKLGHFKSPKVRQEQYETDSEIAAEMLWNCYMNKDLEARTIADLGCGTGVLGLGAALLGAEKVYMVDDDDDAISRAKENALFLEKETGMGINKKLRFIEMDVKGLKIHVDTVIQNPPFGVQQRHADRVFLEKAFSISDTIYTIHKTESSKFFEEMARHYGFAITNILSFDMPIKATQTFHKKRIHRFKAACFVFRKQLNI